MALRRGRGSAIVLALLVLIAGLAGTASADTGAAYPVLRGDDAQLRDWIERYDAAQRCRYSGLHRHDALDDLADPRNSPHRT